MKPLLLELPGGTDLDVASKAYRTKHSPLINIAHPGFGAKNTTDSPTWDNTDALLAAEEMRLSEGCGTIYIPPGQWRVVDGLIRLSTLGAHILGAGVRSSEILWDPTGDEDTDKVLFHFQTFDGSVIYQPSIRNLSVRSTLTNAARKTVVKLIDSSEAVIERLMTNTISTSNSFDGSMFTTKPSRSIDIYGRELAEILHCSLYSDQNIHLGRNPQWVSSGPGDVVCISADSFTVRKLYSLTNARNQYHITADDNIGMHSNWKMEGQNTFIMGKGVYSWDASTASDDDSNDVTSMDFGSFRHESASGVAGAFGIYINHPKKDIYNLNVRGANFSTNIGGIFGRGIRHGKVSNSNYAGTSGALNAIDLLGSKVKGWDHDNFWIAAGAGISTPEMDASDGSGKLYYVETQLPVNMHWEPRGETIPLSGVFDNPAASFFLGPFLKFLTATCKWIMPSTVLQLLDSTGTTILGQIFNAGSIAWNNAISATAFNASGNITATLDHVGRSHYSQRVNTAFAGGPIPAATPTTVMALPGAGPSQYLVQATLIAMGSQHQAYARIAQGDTGGPILFGHTTPPGGTTLAITLSGSNVQITQNEGGAKNCIITIVGLT